MEIRYLKEFLVMAEELNFSNASKRLYISQPVLSKHIKMLETELTLPLFIRNSRNVKLTEFGNLYLTYAKKVVKLYEESELERQKYICNHTKTIKLGTVRYAYYFDVDRVLIAFKKQYPDYHFKLIEGTDYKIMEMYYEGEVNLFTDSLLLDGSYDELDYDYIPVGYGSIKIYINKNHPLSHKKVIALSELHHEALFLPPEDSKALTVINNIFAENGTKIDAPFHGDYNTSRKFVEANMGIALLPEETLMDIPEHTKVTDTYPEIRFVRTLAYRKEGLSAPEKCFVDFLAQMMKEEAK